MSLLLRAGHHGDTIAVLGSSTNHSRATNIDQLDAFVERLAARDSLGTAGDARVR